MDSDPTKKSNNHQPPDDLNDIPKVNDGLREHVGSTYDAREVIADVLWDNTTVYEYAVHRGQIEVKDVEPSIRDSQAFQDFITEYGWPTAKEDNGIELPNLYDSNDEPDYDAFLDAFLSRSLKVKTEDDEADEDDESKVGDLIPDHEADLGNFRLWLIVEPSDQPFSGGGMEQFYATHPALHRLCAIMPELMPAVRRLVKDIYDRNVGGQAKNDTLGFANEMSAGVNEELVKAIYLIYQVAGRLLKADDKTRHRKILGMPEVKTKITNAHDELRA